MTEKLSGLTQIIPINKKSSICKLTSKLNMFVFNCVIVCKVYFRLSTINMKRLTLAKDLLNGLDDLRLLTRKNVNLHNTYPCLQLQSSEVGKLGILQPVGQCEVTEVILTRE